MEIEAKLGRYVLNGVIFKLQLPDQHTYRPQYQINPENLEEGVIIGHVVQLPSGPTLVISQIIRIHQETDDFSVIGWPSHVTSAPILHHWDTRPLSALPVRDFFLDLNSIQCIFKKQ